MRNCQVGWRITMLRGVHVWLLSYAACLWILGGNAYTGFDGGNSSSIFPDWMFGADYVSKCEFDNLTSICDWTSISQLRNQSGTVVQLVSDFLNISEESCLEFWYYLPVKNSSELRVLLRDDSGEATLWSTENTEESDAWKQVLIPLVLPEETLIQIILQNTQILSVGEEINFDHVGVRKGQCGEQCGEDSKFWNDETTFCSCRSGLLSCSPSNCTEGQSCIQNSGAVYGTCTVYSKSQYMTFDRANFHFVGNCTYVLARTCENSTGLSDFSVEIRNKQHSNASVSIVEEVIVTVEGLRVSLLRKEYERAMVSGIWRKLPLVLPGRRLMIRRQESAVVLETDFMLSVSLHASGKVQVNAPQWYLNNLCGLCGNFNHVKEDDYQRPDGSMAEDVWSLGESWRSIDASCHLPFQPSSCSLPEEHEYASEPYCGILLSEHGPFADCSVVLSFKSYFSSCISDMCANNGDPVTFCNLLQTYADTCRKVGISIPAWRNSTFCPLTCAENSHYNSCASGCPDACSRHDAPENCEGCEERCECEPGFMLSGGQCVLPHDCGCWVDGDHYEKGMTFMDQSCERKCQCMGQDIVQCSAAFCSANEVCKVKDGVMGCFRENSATCRVYGDPHYMTFDGKAYNFQGGCNYTLAKTCGHSTVQFTVTTRNENWEQPTWSSLNSVSLEVDGLHIALRKDKKVYVNEAEVTLPAQPSAEIQISINGSYVQLHTSFGLMLLLDGEHRLFVKVNERYKGQMCGLCGTYSGNQYDDFVTPEGEILAKPNPFGNSWRVPDNNWKCSEELPEEPICPSELKDEGYLHCSKLYEDTFADCHILVPPQIYVNSCVTDYCATGGDEQKTCTSLTSYVVACEVAGLNMGEWWKDTACAILKPTPTSPGPVTTTTPAHGLCHLDCNFDVNECDWEQLVQDSFDWTRFSGPTPSSLTGPSNDHTTGRGFYMYIEGDRVHQGDSARIMSSSCPILGTHCLVFWYHMYGMAISMAINVYQLQGNKVTKIWSMANNQGNTWRVAKIQFTTSEAFKIIVEGIRGSNPLSDVAIDDMTLRFGECGDFSDTEVEVTTELTVTDEVFEPHEVCAINCTFDSDFCAWHQLLTDSFDWTWQSNYTSTPKTGPSFDHTSGAGHYAYIEGDGVSNGDTARLLSKQCSDHGPQCLQFWYHMYGTASTMGLSVYLLETGSTQSVWTKRDNQGDNWNKAQVDLNPTGPFQIIFEGRRGTTELSDVALDDVSLHRGFCSDIENAEEPVASVDNNAGAQLLILNPIRPPRPTLKSNTAAPPSAKALNPDTPSATEPVGPGPSSFAPKTWPQFVTASSTSEASAITLPTPAAPQSELSCSRNSHYTNCMSSCQPTCQHLRGSPLCTVNEPCVEGCVCNAGYVLRNQVCVPIHNCGCQDDRGNTHHFDEVWYTDHCAQRCKCEEGRGKGEPECEDFVCPGDSVCHLSEVAQFSCTPTNFSVCSIEDDFKFQTFDKTEYNFEARHSYVLVRTTGLSLPEVYIEAVYQTSSSQSNEEDADDSDEDENSDEENSRPHYLSGIKIRVYNHTVELKKYFSLTLDGLSSSAPVSPSPGLKILKQSSQIHLKTDFGLSVKFNSENEAEITLPQTYKRKVKGLCGNFDGSSGNDMKKPNGRRPTTLKEFIESWQVAGDEI
ncbi:zonadhesin isoform X2 [Denticeps clupeoides]|uniref:Zonadhesin n=1 Tax=Denticeps clupeoides TaxID=299321 RepID=A0AAY4AKP6_9TELE|nr:zonadhesin-like isoform X2 [Denticeps clupeoides]